MAAIHALDEQHILKTRRSHEDYPGALPLKERVETEGGSQHDGGSTFDVESRFPDNPDQGLDRIFRGGRKLADDELARGIVQPDQIGKRATGVDTASDAGMNCEAF